MCSSDLDPEGASGRAGGSRAVPQVRDQRRDAVQLALEVRRDGRVDARKLKTLEEENRKLKQLVADQSLDKVMLQDVLSKKL